MAKIRKQRPRPHKVFVDTSTLWHEDKSEPVDPKFDDFWNKHSSEFDLTLLIPEVVRGELLYQHVLPALDSLSRANSEIQKVSKITSKNYSHRVTEQRVHREIANRLDAWISSHDADIISTPVATIDWRRILDEAIWRTPPFTKDKKSEKGFRDAMILETIVQYTTNFHNEEPIVFLCRDRLLRETTASRLAHIETFLTFEFIADIESYLDLTLEQLEGKFVRSITRKASRKFFNPKDTSCLIYKENIEPQLNELIKPYLDSPNNAVSSKQGLGAMLMISGSQNWEPIGSGKYWVYSPQFRKTEGKNIYFWDSPISYVRKYSQTQAAINPKIIDYQAYEERILVLELRVEWSSKITADGRFRDCHIETIKLENKDFRVPSEDDLNRWELD